MKIQTIIAAAVMASSTGLLAQVYTWNGSTTGGGTGVNNTWDTATANWTGAGTIWPTSGTANEAVFGTTAGTVTISGGVTANKLTFNIGGYTLQSSILTLNGTTPTIDATTGNTTIGSTIAGSAGLTKSGAGTLSLTAQNSYTGGTVVNNGTLTLGNASSNGIIRGALAINSGATVNASGQNWSLGFGGTGNSVTTIDINGGTLNFSGAALDGGTVATSITMTGGSITGTAMAWFHSNTTTPTLNTLASATTSTISSAIGLRLNGDATGKLIFNVADGAAATDLLVSGAIFKTAGADGGGAIEKTGTGTMQLSAANTYTGNTTVSAGTLLVSSTGSISNSSAITVAAGAKLINNSATTRTGTITLDGNGTNSRAILGGNGTIGTAITLNNLGDTLSPGNSPGLQIFSVSQSWDSFTYLWEVNDWDSTTAGTGFDQINITGGLTLNLAGSYALDITSLTLGNVNGNVANFSEADRSWTILSTTTGITNFDASRWTLNTTNFSSDPTRLGTFSLTRSLDGNNLVLNYAAIPEPSTYVLIAISLTAFVIFRRRRHAA